MAADFLDEKRKEIGARLTELKPLVEEYQRLEAAAAALDGVPSTTLARSERSSSRNPKSARRRTAARRAPAGRAGSVRPGTRKAQALALVKRNPGITIAQIAEHMGIKQNYLYRVLPELAAAGRVVKQGRGWSVKPSDG